MSTDGVSQDHLNGQSAVILVVFVVVSFFVIWPVHVPLPAFLTRTIFRILQSIRIVDSKTSDEFLAGARGLRFPLSLETAPVIGVLLLLATTTINGSTIRLGIKGDENVKPYDVLILFISLAYIAIALDGTGALEAVAFWVSKKGGDSGPRLYAYLYAFFLFTGCIVGNDPLILSGTPFLAYLTKHTGLDPTPWIFGEFIAANTASAVLVSSNPTNILITGSFNLNYLTDFTKWTVLPSLVAGVLNYGVLYVMFRNRIPKKLVPLKDDPWTKLRDPKGSLFLSVLMLVTITVLVGTSFVPGHGVQVWMVTAPAGILALTFNIISDLVSPQHQQLVTEEKHVDPAADARAVNPAPTSAAAPISTAKQVSEDHHQYHTTATTTTTMMTEKHAPATNSANSQKPEPPPPLPQKTFLNDTSTSTSTSTHKQQQNHQYQHHHHHPRTLLTFLQTLTHKFPSTTKTITLLPLPLLPFAMAEFILIRGLSQRGWIHTFATGFRHACHSSSSPSPVTTVFFIGFVSAAFLCPFAGTNIGATILLVEILQDPGFTSSTSSSSTSSTTTTTSINNDNVNDNEGARILRAAVYATALGSNLGAFSYVFAASLAGLLWRGLLRDKGVVVGRGRFCLVNLSPLVLSTAVACAVLVGQVYWFG